MVVILTDHARKMTLRNHQLRWSSQFLLFIIRGEYYGHMSGCVQCVYGVCDVGTVCTGIYGVHNACVVCTVRVRCVYNVGRTLGLQLRLCGQRHVGLT